MLTVGSMLTLSNATVTVDAVAAVLDTTMFETTVVVADGTVYSVVPVLVVNAVRANALVTVAISYYLSY
jgi:hypothetical protein